MDGQSIIIWLIVGAIAGWLAGMVVKGGGFGLIGDIIVGIIGAVIAGWLAGIFIKGGGFGLIGDIIVGIIGAFIGRWLLVNLHLLNQAHIAIGGGPFVRDLVTATIGAVVLLIIIRIVRRI